MLRNVALGAALAEDVPDFNEPPFPKAAVLIGVDVFPVRFKPQSDFFLEFTLNLGRSVFAYKFLDGFFAVFLFQFSKVKFYFKNRVFM